MIIYTASILSAVGGGGREGSKKRRRMSMKTRRRNERSSTIGGQTVSADTSCPVIYRGEQKSLSDLYPDSKRLYYKRRKNHRDKSSRTAVVQKSYSVGSQFVAIGCRSVAVELLKSSRDSRALYMSLMISTTNEQRKS